MSAPKQSFAPPLAAPLAEKDGTASHPYQQFYDRIGKTAETLRQAASGMDELESGATTGEIVDVLNALRSKLQEIV